MILLENIIFVVAVPPIAVRIADELWDRVFDGLDLRALLLLGLLQVPRVFANGARTR